MVGPLNFILSLISVVIGVILSRKWHVNTSLNRSSCVDDDPNSGTVTDLKCRRWDTILRVCREFPRGMPTNKCRIPLNVQQFLLFFGIAGCIIGILVGIFLYKRVKSNK